MGYGFHLAPNKFKACARTEHKPVSCLDPVQHPNHLTNFPSRHNYIINFNLQINAYNNCKWHDCIVLQFRILNPLIRTLRKISHYLFLFWIKVIKNKTSEQEIIFFTTKLFFFFDFFKHCSKIKAPLLAAGCNS